MCPNISIWCTTRERTVTLPALEGELAERTCLVSDVTGLLTLAHGPTLREGHCTAEGGLGFPQGGCSGFGRVYAVWALGVQACSQLPCFLLPDVQTLLGAGDV